jgi:hypothetical protein
MNINLEFENEDLSHDNIEDNHPRTNYGEGWTQETLEEFIERHGITKQTLVDVYEEYLKNALIEFNSQKMYSEEDMFEFSQWISHEDWVYLPSKGYWVNEEQEELEQKLSSKEILNLWVEQLKKK